MSARREASFPKDWRRWHRVPNWERSSTGLDRSTLNGHQMVMVLQASARMVAHYQARMYADMMEVALSPAGDAESRPERIDNLDEDSAAEIGAALHLTRRAADIALGIAWNLTGRLPEVGEALSAGLIDLPGPGDL